jgi:hypothetical protein
VPVPIAVIEPPPERVIPDEPLPEDAGRVLGGAVRSRDEAIEVRIPRKPGRDRGAARRLPVLARPVELRGGDGAHLSQRVDPPGSTSTSARAQ